VEGLWLAYQVISQTPITGGTDVLFPYDINQCSASFTNLYTANASFFFNTTSNTTNSNVSEVPCPIPFAAILCRASVRRCVGV
jgi:hypothetical protein